MKNRVRFFFLFLGLLGALAVHAQINELPRSTPEAEGVPSKAVTALFDSLMADRKSTRLNSSHYQQSRMPSSA